MTRFAIHLFIQYIYSVQLILWLQLIITIPVPDIFTARLVLIPIHHVMGEVYEGAGRKTIGHWTLVAIDMPNWTIIHFDSLPGAHQRSTGILEKINRFLMWEAEAKKQAKIPPFKRERREVNLSLTE